MLARLTLLTTLTLAISVAHIANNSALADSTLVQPHIENSFDQALARAGSDGDLEVQYTVSKPVYVQVPGIYTVEVKYAEQSVDPATNQPATVWKTATETRTRTRTVSKLVYETVIRKLTCEAARAVEIGGGTIEPGKLCERLAKPTLVLISHDGKPIPESYAVLFQPETLVLDLTPPAALPLPIPPAGVAPVPLPAVATPVPSPAPASAPIPTPMPAPAASPIAMLVPMPRELPQGDFALPTTFPPLFRMASIDAENQFVLRVRISSEIPETKYVTMTETRLAEGKEISVCVCKPITVLQRYEASIATVVPANQMTGQTVEGNPMEDLHLKALKAREIPVLVSREGKPVDPFWQQNLKPKMLMLVPPAPQPLPQPSPVPASVAPAATP